MNSNNPHIGRDPNWFGDLLRDLRKRQHLSLDAMAKKYGIAAVTVGSYERSQRNASVARADEILNCFGMELAAVPQGYDVERLIRENTELRAFQRRVLAAAEAEGLVVRPTLSAVPDERAA